MSEPTPFAALADQAARRIRHRARVLPRLALGVGAGFALVVVGFYEGALCLLLPLALLLVVTAFLSVRAPLRAARVLEEQKSRPPPRYWTSPEGELGFVTEEGVFLHPPGTLVPFEGPLRVAAVSYLPEAHALRLGLRRERRARSGEEKVLTASRDLPLSRSISGDEAQSFAAFAQERCRP